ncbi:hypothetical protein [Streptomyces sp. 891-h]|uniref:hypothetical protein n=1 Tax=unclassified Streptomyces TaxID=2593676 RepID=UPI001FAA267E|nr:hypothetical protein [Streptomyces sp. 891-h]UNZ19898.1 hypothetical protein HC362_25500 [Streptomyces sp. 891-h]
MSGHALAKVTVSSAQGAADSVDQDWRFAELTAQCCLDPALAVRYAVEPRSVLAEFGIATDERTHIPALPSGPGAEVTITSLNPRDTVGHSAACSSWTFAHPAEPGLPPASLAPAETAF